MRKPILLQLAICLAGLILSSATLSAGEKKLMHCFTFTAVESASQAEWDAFFKATDALPGKIPGLTRVWYGKLRAPQAIFGTDAETRKKVQAGEKATGPVTRVVRQWGVCMEMNDLSMLKTYAASPAHKEWDAVYSKVRVAGTTTFDLIGQ
jgi:hypothetical protein